LNGHLAAKPSSALEDLAKRRRTAQGLAQLGAGRAVAVGEKKVERV
jgi:hypothetical protein